jgi:phosphonopyruvate decarboxylase
VIEASDFVVAARRMGFDWYAGVPCSFLTPFINHVIHDTALYYLSAANEGDAVAAAAGAAVGGRRAVVMIQNSGLGNAVSPLTSLTHCFRIPLLLICTHRGAPGLKDEPQHELMGRITARLLETMGIPWEPFPAEAHEIEAILDRAVAYQARAQRPYALVMQRGAVAPHPLEPQPAPCPAAAPKEPGQFFGPGPRPTRAEALRCVIEHSPIDGTVVIATTGYTGRELYALADRSNHFYMVGSMGCASSFGLGLALARPDLRIIVVDGDGAALMRMGNLATVGALGGPNLVHLILDNEAHDSTGGQATVTASVAFAHIGRACEYGTVMEGDQLGLIEALFEAETDGRPRLGHLKIQTGTLQDLPRPALAPPEVVRRLMHYIGTLF